MTSHIDNDTMSCHVMSCLYDMTFTKFTRHDSIWNDIIWPHITWYVRSYDMTWCDLMQKWHIMSCYIISYCHTILSQIMLCYFMPSYIILCHIISWHVIDRLCHDTSCHVRSNNVLSNLLKNTVSTTSHNSMNPGFNESWFD